MVEQEPCKLLMLVRFQLEAPPPVSNRAYYTRDKYNLSFTKVRLEVYSVLYENQERAYDLH